MPYPVEILSRSLEGGLTLFLVSFAALTLYVLLRRREKKRSLLDEITAEYLGRYPDLAPHTPPSAAKREILRPLWRFFWISLALGLVTFLALAFTPVSYFSNFSSTAANQQESLELKALHLDMQSNPMKIDGAVTNISPQALQAVQVHLILYDAYSTPLAVRTTDIAEALAPEQSASFSMTEPKSETVRRVGITFSSESRPLRHRESAPPKEP